MREIGIMPLWAFYFLIYKAVVENVNTVIEKMAGRMIAPTIPARAKYSQLRLECEARQYRRVRDA